MADNAFISKLADKIAARADLPYVPEEFEAPIINGALQLAIGQLPEKYVAWLTSAADGIDDVEAAGVTAWLLELMNTHGSAVPVILRTWAATAVVGLLRKGVAVTIE
jgi:hypothetical protein